MTDRIEQLCPGQVARISLDANKCDACGAKTACMEARIANLDGVFSSSRCQWRSVCPKCEVLVPFAGICASIVHHTVPTLLDLQNVRVPRTDPAAEPTFGNQNGQVTFTEEDDGQIGGIVLHLKWTQKHQVTGVPVIGEKSVSADAFFALNSSLTVPIGFKIPAFDDCPGLPKQRYEFWVEQARDLVGRLTRANAHFVVCDDK